MHPSVSTLRIQGLYRSLRSLGYRAARAAIFTTHGSKMAGVSVHELLRIYELASFGGREFE